MGRAWLWTRLWLQSIIIGAVNGRVKLAPSIHNRVVCQLSSFIVIITVCLLLRAVVITALLEQWQRQTRMHSYTSWANKMSFVVYTLLSFWLPFILTAFCLFVSG